MIQIPGFRVTVSADGNYYRINREGDDNLESFWFSVLKDGDRWVWTMSAGPYILDSGNRGTAFYAMREAVGRLYSYLHSLTIVAKGADFKMWEIEKKHQQKEFINGIREHGREDNATEETGIPVDTESGRDVVDIQGGELHDPDNDPNDNVAPVEDTRRDRSNVSD